MYRENSEEAEHSRRKEVNEVKIKREIVYTTNVYKIFWMKVAVLPRHENQWKKWTRTKWKEK